MTIDPRYLHLVRAIVQHRSFNRAADALGMSQPALSKSIALLERRVGAKIFERGARGSTLTEIGDVIARCADNLELLVLRAEQEIAAKANRIAGPLVIGATPSLMVGIVPEAVARLTGAATGLSITMIEGLDDTLMPALLKGEIDILVGPVKALHEPPAGIIEVKLAEERFCVGVGPDHRLARRKILHLRDLAEEAWVLPTSGSSFYRVTEALFMASGISLPRNCIVTSNLATHERLMATGGRIGFGTAAQLYGRNSPIRLLALASGPMRAIGVRRKEGIKLPILADDFIGVLKDVMRELPD